MPPAVVAHAMASRLQADIDRHLQAQALTAVLDVDEHRKQMAGDNSVLHDLLGRIELTMIARLGQELDRQPQET